jgi:hypothetical protein
LRRMEQRLATYSLRRRVWTDPVYIEHAITLS